MRPDGPNLPDEAAGRGRLRHAAWLAGSLGGRRPSAFTQEDIERLAEAITVVRVPRMTRLLAQGQPVDFVAVIESGQVELSRRIGLRRVVLRILRAGDLLGDTAYLRRSECPFHARALTEVVYVRLADRAVTDLVRTRPALAWALLTNLATRLEAAHRQLARFRRQNLRSRIASLLLDHQDPDGGPVRLPQSTLAQLAGASRSSVNRILKDFEDEGWLRVAYRQVDILDAEGLRREQRAVGWPSATRSEM